MLTSKKNLMIVDDEIPMRLLLTDFFESQGYEVRCFSSALEALKSLRTSAPTAIIADVRMYPMSGIDFLEIVKRDFTRVPVFLFTGNGSPDEQSKALKMGASSYLSKPFSLTVLKQLLDGVVDGKAPKARSTKNTD